MTRIFSSFSLLFIAFLLIARPLAAQEVNPYASAVDYNDYIVNAQNDIGQAMIGFNEVFASAEVDEETANRSFNHLLSVIEESVSKLEALKDYQGNTELRDASRALFGFYKRVVENEYKELMGLMLKPEFTTQDEERLYELMNKISTEEGSYDDAFEKAQTAFAAQHGFQLGENELQKEIDGE